MKKKNNKTKELAASLYLMICNLCYGAILLGNFVIFWFLGIAFYGVLSAGRVSSTLLCCLIVMVFNIMIWCVVYNDAWDRKKMKQSIKELQD